MDNKLILSSLFYALIILFSCSKEKPKEGEYGGVFTYDFGKNEKFGSVEISDPSKKSVIFNGFKIEKDGRKIFGMIGSIPNIGTNITIDAQWKHSPFSDKYSISGIFYYNQYYLSGNPPQKISGTFRINN